MNQQIRQGLKNILEPRMGLGRKQKFLTRLLQGEDITIVDFGARDLGFHFFHSTTKFAHFVGVECELEEAKKLKSQTHSIDYRSFSLSDKGISLTGEEATLYITPNAGSSSTKKPLLSYALKYNRPGAYTSTQKQTIKTQTVENLIRDKEAKGGADFQVRY
jgi:hypothetical protein